MKTQFGVKHKWNPHIIIEIFEALVKTHYAIHYYYNHNKFFTHNRIESYNTNDNHPLSHFFQRVKLYTSVWKLK